MQTLRFTERGSNFIVEKWKSFLRNGTDLSARRRKSGNWKDKEGNYQLPLARLEISSGRWEMPYGTARGTKGLSGGGLKR